MNATWFYLTLIKDFPVLSHKEQRTLIRKAQRGGCGSKKARDKLIKSYLKFVAMFARRYKSKHLTYLDLISEGNIGLMRAIEKFDLKRKNRFSTYAYYWIRAKITRAIANKEFQVRVPVFIYEQVGKHNMAMERVKGRNFGTATLKEIAKEMKMSERKVKEIRKKILSVVSLNALVGDDRDTEFESFFSSTPVLPKIIDMEEILSPLDEREKEVLKLRFGLNGHGKRTLQKVGKSLRVSRERVRQLEKKSLAKVRKHLDFKEIISNLPEEPDKSI